MTGSSGALSRCVALPSQDFAAEAWGLKPLLTRAGELPTGFDDLFSARAVDELVSGRGLRTPFARMAKNGSVLPAARYTGPAGAGATIADQLADEKVLAQLADGATLVLQALHRTWAPLTEFGGLLSEELGHPVQINAYITPPGNRGFSAHYDTHDVFVLQIVGRKRWRIHEPVLLHPLPDQVWESVRAEVEAQAGQPPLMDVVLEPGDCLYLPRGYLHQAEADDELCIHLTVGVHPITTAAVLHHLVDVAADDPALRASLPAGIDVADPSAVAEVLVSAAKLLLQRTAEPDDDVMAAVSQRLTSERSRAVRPAPLEPLAQLALQSDLTDLTVLRRRVGLHVTTSLVSGVLRVQHGDRSFTLAPSMQTSVQRILSGAPFSPSELTDLDPDERMVLTRRLLAEAVVVGVGRP